MALKKFMKVFVLVCLLTLVLSPVAVQAQLDLQAHLDNYLANELPQGWGVVSSDAFFSETLENPDLFILDVRESAELEELGYILGAVHVPLRELAANLDMLPADLDTPIVIYCKGGHRGAIGMTALQVLGYSNVRNLAGGITGWIGAEYEVITDPYVAPEPGTAAEIDAELVATVDNYLLNVLPEGWGSTSVEDLSLSMLEDAPFLLDVREPAELEELGYIDGSVHIPLRELAANLDQIPTDRPIVVYCKSGHRGTIGTTVLQMLGYEATNLSGGIVGWISAGYEVIGGMEQAEEADAGEIDLVARMDTYLQSELPEGWAVITPDDLFAETLENPDLFLLDVRQPEELEADGYILGAVHVPLRELAANLDMLPADKDAPIVIYCKAGARGAIGMTALQVMGYSNVRNLAGGIMNWIGSEYEVITDPYVAPEPGTAADIDPALVEIVDDYLHNVLPEGWGIVSVADFSVEIVENPDLFVLDVRQPAELEDLGYIDGSVHIPLRELAANLDQIPTDRPIVVYCKSGHRGAIGTTVLQMLGYDARNLGGGIVGWISAGNDVVGGAPAEEVEAVEVELPVGEPLTAEELQPIVVESVVALANADGFASISADTLMAEMDSAFLLDVREADEYAEGFIPGAVHVPVRDVAKNLHLLPAFDQRIIVYCASGHCGALATMALKMLGYEDVVNLRGGVRSFPADQLVTGPAPEVAPAPFPEVDANLWASVDAYMSNLPAGFTAVKADDLNLEMLESDAPVIVDIREGAEFEAGHIAGSVSVPMRSFDSSMGDLPEMGTPMVLVGSIGHRSAIVMMGLQMLGYEDVRSMGGGTSAWESAGYELGTE